MRDLNLKRVLLWSALMATCVWAYLLEGEDETTIETVAPVTRKLSENGADTLSGNARMYALTKRVEVAQIVDLFAVASKEVPKAETKSRVTPVLPPLPFKYVGRWNDGADWMVILRLNEDDGLLFVKTGEIILDKYMLQSITSNPQGLQLAWQYLPLKAAQIMMVEGEMNASGD